MKEITDIRALLEWYIFSGVSETTSEICCFSAKAPETSVPQSHQAGMVLSHIPAEAVKNARELCQTAQNLEELKTCLERFEGCSLKLTAKSTILGAGHPHAEILICGEAPGADEDRIGQPFVGRSGRLLDKMLASIGVSRESVYITNVLPWRPPGNRTPTDSEIAVCLPFLKRQIELINPKILLLLGGIAANTVLETNESISHLRGRFLEYQTVDHHTIPAIASFHPAFLLRNSAQKAKAWTDFLRILKKLKEN